MSDRLYYTDSYTTTFDAQIVERLIFNDKPAVVLDQTCFYPTSGGQPHDVGTFSGVDSDSGLSFKIKVIDVIVRKEDGLIIHLLENNSLEINNIAGRVIGEVDWQRRFDHMQHHCGQHILSRAFIDAVDAPTLSFHMGPEFCTIDIDATALTKTQVTMAETLANQIVQQNRPVEISQVSVEEAQLMPIRKLPPVEGGLIRLVDITGFDLTACGGTHVARTGEIGLIKVTRLERRKKMLRVEFLCGNRAIANYGRKTDILDDLIRQLSTGADSLLGSVEKLQKEMKALEREVRNLRKEQLAIVASQIEDKFEQVNDTHILTHVFSNGESLDSLRQIANILTLSENRIVLLGSSGDQAMLLFRSSAEEKYHMGNLLRTVLDAIGSKSGGGQQSLAQGGGQPASDQEISVALDDAKGRVAKQFFV